MKKKLILFAFILLSFACKKDAPGDNGVNFSATTAKPFTVTVQITNNDGSMITAYENKENISSPYSFVKDFVASKSKVYVTVYTEANQSIDGTLKVKGKIITPSETVINDTQLNQSRKTWNVTAP